MGWSEKPGLGHLDTLLKTHPSILPLQKLLEALTCRLGLNWECSTGDCSSLSLFSLLGFGPFWIWFQFVGWGFGVLWLEICGIGYNPLRNGLISDMGLLLFVLYSPFSSLFGLN